jgi:hypothetical protein
LRAVDGQTGSCRSPRAMVLPHHHCSRKTPQRLAMHLVEESANRKLRIAAQSRFQFGKFGVNRVHRNLRCMNAWEMLTNRSDWSDLFREIARALGIADAKIGGTRCVHGSPRVPFLDAGAHLQSREYAGTHGMSNCSGIDDHIDSWRISWD